jgi:hypothetical protein
MMPMLRSFEVSKVMKTIHGWNDSEYGKTGSFAKRQSPGQRLSLPTTETANDIGGTARCPARSTTLVKLPDRMVLQSGHAGHRKHSFKAKPPSYHEAKSPKLHEPTSVTPRKKKPRHGHLPYRGDL